MSGSRQRTVSRPTTLKGVGLHSGEEVALTLHPAEAGSGLRFRRVDLEGRPEIPADLDHVTGTDLGTTLGAGEATVMTVEHVLGALAAHQIDNALMEVSGPEVPIRDGSFQDYFQAVVEAGPVEQNAEARMVVVTDPVSYSSGADQSYVATRHDGLSVSATIDFSHSQIGRQYGSFRIDRDAFATELARARTFGFKAEAEALRSRGLARGASLENTIVLDETGVMNEGLRFDDEFLRHKIGDIVGDLALLGGRVRAHVVAEKPGHGGTIEFAKAIRAQLRRSVREPVIDIARIMQFLPHRYPMLLVDRILELEERKRIVGLKNVTINEPFFQGHYPGHPIMPGVLIVEAMAQVGGLLLMSELGDSGDKVVYFMTIDNVKFRRPVVPGDTLIFELEVLQLRRGICKMRGVGRVDGKVATEAEFMASIVDK